jgi:hypothetical protein
MSRSNAATSRSICFSVGTEGRPIFVGFLVFFRSKVRHTAEMDRPVASAWATLEEPKLQHLTEKTSPRGRGETYGKGVVKYPTGCYEKSLWLSKLGSSYTTLRRSYAGGAYADGGGIASGIHAHGYQATIAYADGTQKPFGIHAQGEQAIELTQMEEPKHEATMPKASRRLSSPLCARVCLKTRTQQCAQGGSPADGAFDKSNSSPHCSFVAEAPPLSRLMGDLAQTVKRVLSCSGTGRHL